ISRMEEGSLRLQHDVIVPGELVDSAMQQVASIAREDGVNLCAEISAGLPVLTGDAQKLRRTLVNLVGNALKFTRRGGSVKVTVSGEQTGELLFSVQDTGEGIPREAFERIFEKFGQVGLQTGRRSSGLGLTFCKLIVEAHGGRIGVASELGKGSTFTFNIPLNGPGASGGRSG
ncbi:MAG: hybrid sensor histidine kinase/response regulator, partial [Chloroflexi bacterium]|nr:hybrid sensor histidine kinase/response regulator [Chloroflexota bacterium]